MSAHADFRQRRGAALLLAIATLVVLALCTLALWQTHTGSLRSDRLHLATFRQAHRADSMLTIATLATLGGAWRTLPPGATTTAAQQRTRDAVATATVTRLGWHTLLARGFVTHGSGVPGVAASTDARLLIPLTPPLPLPSAALTGGAVWMIDSLASVTLAAPTPDERRCRYGVVPRTDTTVISMRRAMPPLQPLDPDTVTGPLVGEFRLIRDRIVRPLVVTGMVESVTGLSVGADLQLAGVLVVQGSVQSAGGRLDVTGAVITGDSGGGRSVLGNGDRVRYDACAIRRAMERLTRPAPAAVWSIVGQF